MKFRPLCVDYHARAQEIVATERAIHARRTALRTLPNPSPPCNRNRRRPSDSHCGDGGGIDSNSGGDAPCDGKENRNESIPTDGDGTDVHLPNDNNNGQPDGQTVVQSNDGGDIMEISEQKAGVNDTENSKRRIQSIMKMLGPAVHPSECAYRPIAPLTKGPVRGYKLTVAASKPPLEEITQFHSNFVERKLNAAFGSLESGRSRFDSSNSDILSVISSGESSQNEGRGLQDSTFVDTMRIVYAQSSSDSHDVEGPFECNPEKENALKSQIWSKHVKELPMPKSVGLLRHEPEDLTKIYRLKSQRSSVTTTFARDISRSFRPQLSTLKGGSHRQTMTKTQRGIALVGSLSDNSGGIPTKPKFDLKSCGVADSREVGEDYSLRLNTVPFTKFLDDTDAGMGMELALTKASFTIRVDPDFDPLRQIPQKKERKPRHDLLKQMDEMYSASSISARLHLPGRFEESHELTNGLSRFILPQSTHQFEFLNGTLESFKESVMMDESLDSMLAVHVPKAVANGMAFLPQKICLDTDIDPPTLLPEEDDASLKPKNVNESLGASILKLPSFSGMMSSTTMAGVGSQRGEKNRQTRFVESSYRVSRADSLKTVVSSSKAGGAMVFLPQSIKTPNSTKDAVAKRKMRQSMEQESISRALISAVRSCVPSTNSPDGLKLLQGQCPSYPIAPWFANASGRRRTGLFYARNAVSSNVSELDSKILNLKRKSFCVLSKKRSSAEGSRTLLLTGCSSRRNVDHKYSYRGFLTNAAVDPSVFNIRYNAMLQLYSKSNPKTPDESFFSRMALGVFTDAFTRKKTKFSKSNRSAPYTSRLKTSRHGQCPISASKSNGSTKTSQKAKVGFSIVVSKIDELATTFRKRLAEDAAFETNCGDDVERVMEALGTNGLKVRGELLWLVAKAHELEDEMKSYLAELAVVNRGRVNTPKHVPFEGLDRADTDTGKENMPSHQAHNIDLTVPDDSQLIGKRKAASELTEVGLKIDEQEDRKSKKKPKKHRKKKEKKKEKKEKKKRKRQRKEAHHTDDSSPKKRKVADTDATVNQHEDGQLDVQQVAEVPYPVSERPNIRVALPAVPLGMTPINPPKKPDISRKPQFVENAQLPQERMDTLAGSTNQVQRSDDPELEDNIVDDGATADKSPDSVAYWNPGTKPNRRHDSEGESVQSHRQTPREQNSGLSQPDENHSVDSPRGSVAEGGEQPEQPERESTFLGNNLDRPTDGTGRHSSPRTLLASESFLETFGEVVAELGGGNWQKSLSKSEKEKVKDTPKGIVVCDCPLLDIAGVDIELPDSSAVIVQYLSSWSKGNQNKNHRGNTASVQLGARAFIRRLVLLAASGRYTSIHVILCIDFEMSSDLSIEILTLQNAVIQQSGCPCESVAFEYIAPRALAASIALRSALVSTPTPQESSQLAEFISDENVQERARFLITLVPTMTVHEALRCLGSSTAGNDNGMVIANEDALQKLFQMGRDTARDLFPYKMEGVLSSVCAEQLWLALNVDISHAY